MPAFPLLLIPRDDDEVDSDRWDSFRHFFNACQAIGGLGLVAILIVALTRRVRRFATWMNFCLAWILSSISYLLLAFFGVQADEVPSKALCTTQAVLIYAAPVLCAYATFSLVVQLWLDVKTSTKKEKSDYSWTTIWLLLFPYLVFVCVLAEATYFGLSRPDTVERNRTCVYCVINTGIPGTISSILVAIAILVVLTIEIITARTLWLHWRVLRSVNNDAEMSWSLLVRIAIFTAFQIVALGSSVAFVLRSTDSIPNGILATLPVVAFVVFGTQKDMIHTFAFWHHRRGLKFWQKRRAGPTPMDPLEIKNSRAPLLQLPSEDDDSRPYRHPY